MNFFLLVLLSVACLREAYAFVPGGTSRRDRHPLQSALSSHQGDSQPLSGLVGDMLNHYQAQAEDLEEVAKATKDASKDGLPQTDKYGIYRIVNENQLQ